MGSDSQTFCFRLPLQLIEKHWHTLIEQSTYQVLKYLWQLLTTYVVCNVDDVIVK